MSLTGRLHRRSTQAEGPRPPTLALPVAAVLPDQGAPGEEVPNPPEWKAISADAQLLLRTQLDEKTRLANDLTAEVESLQSELATARVSLSVASDELEWERLELEEAQRTIESMAADAAIAGRYDAPRRELETVMLERDQLREQNQTAATVMLSLIDAIDDVTQLAAHSKKKRLRTGAAELTKHTRGLLDAFGLDEVLAAGVSFNPEDHEIDSAVPTADARTSGKVVDVVRRGFRYQGQVTRKAHVVVAE